MSQGDYIRFLKTVQALQTNREAQVLTHTEYTSIQTYNTETSVNNTKSAFGEVSYSDTTRLLPSEDLQAVNTGPTNQGTTASSEDAVLLGATQTLTNKTFTNPVINGQITGTYTIKDSAIPANILRTDTPNTFTQNIVQTSSGIINQTGTGTNSLKETTITSGNLTLTSGNIIFTQGNKIITNGTSVLTLPTTTTVLIGDNTTNTLTHKTLTNPTINNPVFSTNQNIGQSETGIISQTGTGTNSLKETTITSGNLTLTSGNLTLTSGNIILSTGSSIKNGSITLTLPSPSGDDSFVSRTSNDTLTGKTLTNPTINNPVFSTTQNIGQSSSGIISQTGTGTNSLKATTITSGNLTLTSGNLTLTSGNIIFSSGTGIISQTGTGTNTMKAITLNNHNLTLSGTGIISQTGTGTNLMRPITFSPDGTGTKLTYYTGFYTEMGSSPTEIKHVVPTGSNTRFVVGTTNTVLINSNGLTLGQGQLHLPTTATGNKITYAPNYVVNTDTNILRTTIPDTATHHFRVGTSDKLYVDVSNIIMDVSNIRMKCNITLPSENIVPTTGQLGYIMSVSLLQAGITTNVTPAPYATLSSLNIGTWYIEGNLCVTYFVNTVDAVLNTLIFVGSTREAQTFNYINGNISSSGCGYVSKMVRITTPTDVTLRARYSPIPSGSIPLTISESNSYFQATRIA